MATKQRADRQKEKEKKEKIILVVLVAVLVIVGAIEIPSLMKKKGPSGNAAPATTQTSGTSSASGVGGTPSATGTSASGPVAIDSLPSSPVYEVGSGQLSRLNLFVEKNPFGATPAEQSAGTNTSNNGTNTSKTGTNTTTTTPGSSFSTAVISVNGTSEVVALGASFPASSPAFRLDSISAKKIAISVAGGSFASGQSEVTIRKGQTVVLVNTTDGLRYALKLIGVSKESRGTSTKAFTNTTTTTTTSPTTTASTTTATS